MQCLYSTYNELPARINREPERPEHETVDFRVGDVHPLEGALHLPIDRSNLVLELLLPLGIEENVVAGQILALGDDSIRVSPSSLGHLATRCTL